MWHDESDPYEATDLDRVLTIEADSALMASSDPEGCLHGGPVPCDGCDGEGRVLVEVIFNGDQSYPDVRDCPACDGEGQRNPELPCPVCTDETSMGEPCDACWRDRIAA